MKSAAKDSIETLKLALGAAQAQKKIEAVLNKILEEYALGAKGETLINFSAHDLLLEGEIEKSQLIRIAEHLKEKGIIEDFIFREDGNLIFPAYDSDYDSCEFKWRKDFAQRANQYLLELSKNPDTDNDDFSFNNSTKIKLIHKGKNFCLQIAGNQKLYFISDDIKSRKAKFIKYLSNPSLGTPKTLDSVFEELKLPKDNPDSDKKTIINGALKELNRILRKEKAPIILRLRWSRDKNSVALLVK